MSVCCIRCHEESRNDYLHGTSHWPIWGDDICIAQKLTRNHVLIATRGADLPQLRRAYDRAWELWRYWPQPAPRAAEEAWLIAARVRMAELERLVEPPTEHHTVPDSEDVDLFELLGVAQ